MVRQLSVKTLKIVIQALREGKKAWSDLKQLRVDGKEIPDKTLERLLKEYLKDWELVEKVDGYWSWYEYSRIDLTPDEQKIFLEHAQKLKPSFDAILSREQEEDRKFAEKHLQTGYPVIYEKLLKFERLEAKLMKLRKSREGQVLKKLESKYIPEEEIFSFGWGKRPRKGWLRKIIPNEAVLVKKNRPPYGFGPFDTLDEIKEIFTTFKVQARVSEKGTSGGYFIWGPIQLEELEKSIKIQNQMYETFQELAGSIGLLMLKVDHGTPLEGKCLLCPPLTHG